MHSCMLQECTAYEPRPLWFKEFCTAVILSGKQQNGNTTLAYSVSCSSKTSDPQYALSIRLGEWRYSTSRIRVVGHVRIVPLARASLLSPL